MRIYIYVIIQYIIQVVHIFIMYMLLLPFFLPAPVKRAVKESRAAKAAAGEDIYIYIIIQYID